MNFCDYKGRLFSLVGKYLCFFDVPSDQKYKFLIFCSIKLLFHLFTNQWIYFLRFAIREILFCKRVFIYFVWHVTMRCDWHTLYAGGFLINLLVNYGIWKWDEGIKNRFVKRMMEEFWKSMARWIFCCLLKVEKVKKREKRRNWELNLRNYQNLQRNQLNWEKVEQKERKNCKENLETS